MMVVESMPVVVPIMTKWVAVRAMEGRLQLQVLAPTHPMPGLPITHVLEVDRAPFHPALWFFQIRLKVYTRVGRVQE